MTTKFIRRDSKRYSKLGKNRKKLQKWRRPKGRDNKMREKRKSYPATVSIGYKSPKAESGKIDGAIPIVVSAPKQLEKLDKKTLVIISGKTGAKKRLEIIKMAQEMKLKMLNVKKTEKIIK